MDRSTKSLLIVFGILALAIMACLPVTFLALPLVESGSTPPDTAATVQAVVTQTIFAVTQTAPTQTPIPPTVTPVPPTSTALPTATPTSYCDWAMFVKDVTVPDGTNFAPGETFTKIWRLKNRGTCAWTADYMLVYTSGASMGDTLAVRLPGYVAPGQTVDVSVTLTAPTTPGHYTGNWMLRNPSGVLFGIGEKANTAFYVDINSVQTLPHGTATGNLCYPSEFNPPLILYFEKAGTQETIQFSIPENQNSFSVLLPNGAYYAYAWAPNYNLEGAYVDQNRLMKTFVVRGGQTTSGINLCDWDAYPHGRGQ
ncbi:MAG: NBR1-Ig-like domain-containing protein [Chloroflexota bacterium]